MKIGMKREMNEMDAVAVTRYGIPSVLLMEHAAYGVFFALKERKEDKVLILCGGGNNGGDGLALARQLVVWGQKDVQVVLAVNPGKLSEDSQVYYNIIKQMGIPIRYWEKIGTEETHLIEEAPLIVDALLGTGVTREVTGFFAELIETVNMKGKGTVISLDIPSGIACDTGKVMGVAIRADETFTFQIPKVGLCVYPGVSYAGKVVCVDIGIPKAYQEEMVTRYQCITEADAKKQVPKRHMRSHKGTYGRVLMIGGSKEMSGAIILSGQAALKAGAGTVTLAVPECIQERVAMQCPEVMTIGLPCVEGHFAKEASNALESLLERFDVIGFGPGIGRDEAIDVLLQAVLDSNKPCVIDADGLYTFSNHLTQIKNRQAPMLLTPHPKEFSRIIGQSIEDILEYPLEKVASFAEQTTAYLVLKLERSIIGGGEEIVINTTGNPALAKGGSGDVLTGLVTGIYAWKNEPMEALKLGVYIHGAAGDYLAQETGGYTLMPTQLLQGIQHVFKQLED